MTEISICNKIMKSFQIDFREERKVLLELIGPELQSMYDDRQIEVNNINIYWILKSQVWCVSYNIYFL